MLRPRFASWSEIGLRLRRRGRCGESLEASGSLEELVAFDMGVARDRREVGVAEVLGAEFGNDATGHQLLHGWVQRSAAGERRFGVESTGWLARGLACFRSSGARTSATYAGR